MFYCIQTEKRLPNMYYSDINIKTVMHHRFLPPGGKKYFIAGNKSFEFIRFGHLPLLRKRNGMVINLSAPAVSECGRMENKEYSDVCHLDTLAKRLRPKEIAYTGHFRADMDFSRNFKKFSGIYSRKY